MGSPSTSSAVDALVLEDLQQREKYINLLELSRNPECAVTTEVQLRNRFFLTCSVSSLC